MQNQAPKRKPAAKSNPGGTKVGKPRNSKSNTGKPKAAKSNAGKTRSERSNAGRPSAVKRRSRSRGKAPALEKLVQCWVLLFLPTYLLLCGEGGFKHISEFKTELFYGFSAVLAVLASDLFWMDYARLRRGKRDGALKTALALSPARLAALCYLGFVLLSAALSPHGSAAWYDAADHEATLTQACYVLIFCAVSRWARPTKGLRLVLLACTAVYCAVILLQLRGRNPFGLYPSGMDYYSVQMRPSYLFAGTTGNGDLVSALLSLMAGFCFCTAFVGEKRELALRAAALVLGLVCFYEMGRIGVLCGIVGTVAGLLLSLFVLMKVNRRTKGFCLLGAAAGGVGMLGFLWKYPTDVTFFQEIHSILHGNISDHFGSGRVYIWRQMIARVPGQIWFGCGPDTARRSGLTPFRRYSSTGHLLEAIITDAHCLPLQILYTQGVFALLTWLVLLGIVLTGWFRREGRTPMLAALGGAAVCFWFTMLFCFSSVIAMPFFWVALGLMAGETEAVES